MVDGFNYTGTVAIIGGGRMGEAILAGLIASGTMNAAQITVAEPSSSRREALVAAHGVRCVADGTDAFPADVTLLAVKPQVAESVISSLAEKLGGSLTISIIAGFSTARIESLLPGGSAVVRAMPNTPALVGEGMAVVSGGSDTTLEQVDLVRALFAQIGRAVVLDEHYQNAATAISGSGPAYFALVIDALARAGVRHGLPRDVAQSLAVQTMRGTALMIEQTGMHPSELIDGVSSPGGTTIASIEALEAGGLRSAFAEAVAANIARSKELGS